MNAKTCKILRGRARGKSTGMPARKLVWRTYREMGTNRLVQQCLINDPNSTRGIYRALKAQYR